MVSNANPIAERRHHLEAIALQEMNRLSEADALIDQALAEAPDNVM